MVSCHIFFKGIGDVLEKASVVSRKIEPFGATIKTLVLSQNGYRKFKIISRAKIELVLKPNCSTTRIY